MRGIEWLVHNLVDARKRVALQRQQEADLEAELKECRQELSVAEEAVSSTEGSLAKFGEVMASVLGTQDPEEAIRMLRAAQPRAILIGTQPRGPETRVEYFVPNQS